MKARRAEASGFTLVELMIVIGITGVVLAMTVPAMARFINSTRLVGARNTLMSDLRLTRSLASAQRRNYELRLAPSGYSIVSLSPSITVLNRTLPRGITCARQDTASFYPWGLTETMTITLNSGVRSSVVRTTSAGQVTHD